MGVEFTVGSAQFKAMSNDARNNRVALAFDAIPICRNRSFSLPGVAGSYGVFSPPEAYMVSCKVRYLGYINEVYSLVASDYTAWVAAPVTIIDPLGVSYSRCQLIGSQIIKPQRGIGFQYSIMDVEHLFRCNGVQTQPTGS